MGHRFEPGPVNFRSVCRVVQGQANDGGPDGLEVDAQRGEGKVDQVQLHQQGRVADGLDVAGAEDADCFSGPGLPQVQKNAECASRQHGHERDV